jgi:transcriptional regulator with GAF, ATPase, and Fis domain
MASTYQTLERQRSRMVTVAGLLLTAVCATLVLVSWWSGVGGFTIEARWPALVGLIGLVLIFILYGQKKHRELAQMEARLRDAAVREASLQARFMELSFLFDISTQLQLRLDLQSMLELATQRLVTCLDATQASIMLRDDQSGLLEVKAAAGVDTAMVSGAQVKPGEGIAGYVFQSGETLILDPEVMTSRFPDDVKRGRNIVSALCVPLRFRGNPIGVVSVTRTLGEPFAQLHAQMLEVFADHCAATVVKTQHHHEVLKQVKAA